MGKLIIKNREEIIEKLTEMLIEFDENCNNYQTDVYLYYDSENQTAELDTFVNVGGNSWLNDNHYTIYCDKEHYENYLSWYQEKQEFADVLEIPIEKLEAEIREYFDLNNEGIDEEIQYGDYIEFFERTDKYTEKLSGAYSDYLDQIRSEYVYRAEEIMEQFDRDCEMED